jgi:hypothetical protein
LSRDSLTPSVNPRCLHRRDTLWGFKGVKGQMFFNMVVNTAPDPTECDQELKAVIAVPTNEDIAKSIRSETLPGVSSLWDTSTNVFVIDETQRRVGPLVNG